MPNLPRHLSEPFSSSSFVSPWSPDAAGPVVQTARDQHASFLPSHTRRMALVMICLQDFLSQIGYGIMLPLFPQEATDRSIDSSVVGWVFGMYQLVTVISAPLALNLMPRVGPMRLLNICNFVDAIANLAFAATWYAPDNLTFVVLCLITRVVAAGATGVSTIVGAALLPIVSGSNLSTGNAILESVCGVSLVLAPIGGSLLYQLGGGSIGIGYVLPYLALGIFRVLFGLFAAKLSPKLPCPDAHHPSLTLFSPKVVLPCSICFVTASAAEFIDPLLQPYLSGHPFYFSVNGVGAVFAIFSFSYVGIGPVVGMVDDWFEGERATALMCFGMVCIAIAYIVLAPPLCLSQFIFKGVVSVFSGLSLMGFGLGFAVIPTYSSMFRNAGHGDEHSSASATSALYNVMYATGAFLGPTLAGWLQDSYSFETLFSMLSLLLILFVLLLIVMAPASDCFQGYMSYSHSVTRQRLGSHPEELDSSFTSGRELGRVG